MRVSICCDFPAQLAQASARLRVVFRRGLAAVGALAPLERRASARPFRPRLRPGRRLAARPQPLLVVVQVAVEDLELAVGHQPERIGHGFDQVTIVGHDHHAALEALQCDGERMAHVDVEVIGRFIQQQQVRPARHQQSQSQARLLAARKSPHRLERAIALEAESAEVIAHALLIALGEIRAAQIAQMPKGIAIRPQLFQLLLREVADAQIRGGNALARQRQPSRRPAFWSKWICPRRWAPAARCGPAGAMDRLIPPTMRRRA